MGLSEILTAFILVGAIQGFLLVIIVNRLPNKNKIANRALSFFLLLVATSLLLQVLQFGGRNKIVFRSFQDILIFTYSPIFYFYIKALLTNQNTPFRRWGWHLIPAGLYLLLFFPIWGGMQVWIIGYGIATTIALTYAVAYILKSHRVLRHFRKTADTPQIFVQYLQIMHWVIVFCLLAFFCKTLMVLLGIPQLIAYLNVFGFNLGWLGIVIITYVLGYFAIFTPEILRKPLNTKPQTTKNPPQKLIHVEDLQKFKDQLKQLMIHQRPFLNPKLTLGDLAKQMQIEKGLMTKVIHQGFNLNFYDFVNTYRVEHFIELSQTEAYQHYDLVSLALEAGFTAKSSFHQAFKKLKNTTPKAYLNSLVKN